MNNKKGYRLFNRGKIYLTIEDLMELLGTKRKNTAYQAHQTIRESIRQGKKNLTIWEYCKYTGDNFEEIFFTLRGEMPKWKPPT